MRSRPTLLPLLLLVALVPVAACDSPAAPPASSSVLDTRIQAGRVADPDLAVSVAFNLHGYTLLESAVPDESCGPPPHLLNVQVGEGEATHLGHFTVRFTFCIDLTDLLDDGMLTDGESAPYWDGVGTYVAANGDELYVAVSGVILPSSDPNYDFQFQDPFTFTGGTGRFAGATGGGMIDSYVSQATNRTDHNWSGALVLRPGR